MKTQPGWALPNLHEAKNVHRKKSRLKKACFKYLVKLEHWDRERNTI